MDFKFITKIVRTIGGNDKLVSSKDWREKINIHSHRYVIEDIKEGLAFIYSLAERLNIKAPITSSLLDITSTILGTNIKKNGSFKPENPIDRQYLFATVRKC